jgi:hypothetical protein
VVATCTLRLVFGMSIEFLQGRPLEPEVLEIIRVALEKLDSLEGLDPELRAIVAQLATPAVENAAERAQHSLTARLGFSSRIISKQ